MIKITHNPDTHELSSMKVSGASVKMLVSVDTREDLETFLSSLKDGDTKNILAIGEGTNTVYVKDNPNLILLKVNFNDTKVLQEEVEVGANVNWDEFVQKYMELGGEGMELLSIIPGTVGAAPVQNIAAYGGEVSQFIKSVNVYDLKERGFKTLTNLDCEFSYRDSLFKKNKGRYLILSILFNIFKKKDSDPKIPKYKDVEEHFLQKNILEPTVQEIRKAIIEIRNNKLPDPRSLPNCGSFFKNPIIRQDQFSKIKSLFPEIPTYKVPNTEEYIKIPIAYILQRLGFKNYNSDFTNGNFGIHKKHALVVVSNGKGTRNEFLEFINTIKQKVFEVTGLQIEEEVSLI